MLKSSSFAKKNTKITGMYLSSSKGLKIKIFQSIAFIAFIKCVSASSQKEIKERHLCEFSNFWKDSESLFPQYKSYSFTRESFLMLRIGKFSFLKKCFLVSLFTDLYGDG